MKKVIGLVIMILVSMVSLIFSTPSLAKQKITIKTDAGNVEINNPRTLLQAEISDDMIIIDRATYLTIFYPQDQDFLIEINDTNYRLAALKAQNAFTKKLGISMEDACKLKIRISVNYQMQGVIKEDVFSEDYGLSYCPGKKGVPGLPATKLKKVEPKTAEKEITPANISKSEAPKAFQTNEHPSSKDANPKVKGIKVLSIQ